LCLHESSEGDRLSGLVVDVIGATAVVSASAAWVALRRDILTPALLETAGLSEVYWRPNLAMLAMEGLGDAPAGLNPGRDVTDASADADADINADTDGVIDADADPDADTGADVSAIGHADAAAAAAASFDDRVIAAGDHGSESQNGSEVCISSNNRFF
jgi:hypothetical protein